ncbi:hypothetical protein Btru_034132 [Bulinus truncatus]|nr:hypothetical protein Btru_034132 [Bulinus truncatus]
MAFVGMSNDLTEEKRSKIALGVLSCFSLGSNREMFCDFTVAIDDFEFPCHRFVLNACSGFFEGMFRCDMRESREMRVILQGMSPDIFRLILDVLYGGCDVVNAENVIQMWHAANQLQISFLIAMYENFVMENNTASNFYETYKHGQDLCSTKVIEFIFNFIAENFYAVTNSESFTLIKYEDLLQLLGDMRVKECCDFQIDAILKWCGAGVRCPAR